MKMRLQHPSYIPILVVALSCLTSGEISGSNDNSKKVSDQPLSLHLGHGLVATKNENASTESLYMEGGSFNKSTTSSPAAATQSNVLKSNSTSPVLPVESVMAMTFPESGHDKNSSIKARKGVSPNIEDTKSTTPSVLCACCVNITTEEQLKNCTCCHIELKSNLTSSTSPPIVTKQIEVKPSETTVNLTKAITIASNVTSSESSLPTVAPSPVPHHHKPNVTSDVPEQQVPAQQEDYVIPVVGIIFAIPLVIILGALVYKKGADLWERRHYRRMDFLIDGIYNQ